VSPASRRMLQQSCTNVTGMQHYAGRSDAQGCCRNAARNSTRMLQECCKNATVLSRMCYNNSTEIMLQQCCSNAAEVQQKYCRNAAAILKEYCRNASRIRHRAGGTRGMKHAQRATLEFTDLKVIFFKRDPLEASFSGRIILYGCRAISSLAPPC